MQDISIPLRVAAAICAGVVLIRRAFRSLSLAYLAFLGSASCLSGWHKTMMRHLRD